MKNYSKFSGFQFILRKCFFYLKRTKYPDHMFNCSRLLPVEVPEPPLQPEDRVLVRHVQHRRRRNILPETTIFKDICPVLKSLCPIWPIQFVLWYVPPRP